MGNNDSRLKFRKAVVELTIKNQSIEANDESFWSQFWSENITNIQDIYTLIPAVEIRALREKAPSNLSTLCFKIIEKIQECSERFLTEKNRITLLNCIRLMTRLIPYIYEDNEWRNFFWSESPIRKKEVQFLNDIPLAQVLINSLINLLFLNDFTVSVNKKLSSEEIQRSSIDTCELIWEAGVGFSQPSQSNAQHDFNRIEILKLILTTLSETIYLPPLVEYHLQPNNWINYFTSFKNQNALPIFTSLINIIFSYDPVGYGVPYNHLMFTDSRETLVEISCQLLCVCLEFNVSFAQEMVDDIQDNEIAMDSFKKSNLFIIYISRIHRDEDFGFILKGFSRLLNNPMIQTILPGSCKKINFFQELLILLWKFFDYNKKFMYYVLKSSEVLEILVPLLYYLIDSREDTSKIGLMHICVFILLMLSGERNFGVRLNKPYVNKVPIDIPVFSGTHADLLILVFHKIITSTNNRLLPLYDCLLTVIVNISPYLKTLSMVSSTKILHLLEAFSTSNFLFANQTNYHLVFFILEMLNNIIQYQFDGNSNLIYTIIRKRSVFFNLLNLQTEQSTIDEASNKQGNRKMSENFKKEIVKSMEGAVPAKGAEPGTLKTTLAETPSVINMTEKTVSTNKEIDEQFEIKKQESLKQTSVQTQSKIDQTDKIKEPPNWKATTEWVLSWKSKLPLQTIMRLLQVLVPQVEKICIDKGLTDESEILKFLQNGTLVGLLPVPHPILIRKYQPNVGTIMWLKTYMWGVIYLRNLDPPIWYDTDVKLFEIQRV